MATEKTKKTPKKTTEKTTGKKDTYPLRLTIDYPEKLDRLTTFFRLIMVLPILIILSLVDGTIASDYGTGIIFSIGFALALMILFCQKYPRWWFDFLVELMRFTTRVLAYGCFLTDKYPSTDNPQAVHLDIDYPNAEELNRFLPFIKWALVIPHWIVLSLLGMLMLPVLLIAWLAILFTGNYPRWAFGYVTGMIRWGLRVMAYAFMMVTDRYPPFRFE